MVVPVHQHDAPIAVVLAGDTSEDVRGESIVKHLNFLVTLTNILVVALRNRALALETLKQEALRRELELAGEMQAMLVPKNWSHLPLDIHGYYQPHTEVEDYYDAFTIPSGDGHLHGGRQWEGHQRRTDDEQLQAQVRALFVADRGA